MPRARYITITIERLKKEDADKIIRHIVSELGAISVLVRPYEAEEEKGE